MLTFVTSAARCVGLALVLVLSPLATEHVAAATSESFTSTSVTATLISVQNGVPPGGAETLSAGLDLVLAEGGWKTYWRSPPGEVGIPPQVDWASSTNVAEVEMLWPAPPMRFTAFGIENFGYSGSVVLPLQITLERPGEPVTLAGAVNLLVCSEVCVPQTFELSMSLQQGTGIDTLSASRIGTYLARVPNEGTLNSITEAIASVDPPEQTALTLQLQSTTAFVAPDVFAELGGAGTAWESQISVWETMVAGSGPAFRF